MIVLFIAFFEFSMGPILWLYNAEIMNNKASTLAAGVNWISVLVVSNFTPYLLEKLHGKLFLLFASFTAIHCIVVFFFMKETKGLTD